MKEGYERDFLRYLQSLLAEVERRIRRGHARLALSQAQQNAGVCALSLKRYSVISAYKMRLLIPQQRNSHVTVAPKDDKIGTADIEK